MLLLHSEHNAISRYINKRSVMNVVEFFGDDFDIMTLLVLIKTRW